MRVTCQQSDSFTEIVPAGNAVDVNPLCIATALVCESVEAHLLLYLLFESCQCGVDVGLIDVHLIQERLTIDAASCPPRVLCRLAPGSADLAESFHNNALHGNQRLSH